MHKTLRWGFSPWIRKIPWRRKWQSTPGFLPGESQDRGAWRATAHRVAKSQTQLSTHAQYTQGQKRWREWPVSSPSRESACTCLWEPREPGRLICPGWIHWVCCRLYTSVRLLYTNSWIIAHYTGRQPAGDNRGYGWHQVFNTFGCLVTSRFKEPYLPEHCLTSYVCSSLSIYPTFNNYTFLFGAEMFLGQQSWATIYGLEGQTSAQSKCSRWSEWTNSLHSCLTLPMILPTQNLPTWARENNPRLTKHPPGYYLL